ncbi:MAG: porin [Algicola sp.]|nr:porin [Algicola sp.]
MNKTTKSFLATTLFTGMTMCPVVQADAELNWSGFATVAATYMNEEHTQYAGHISDGFSFNDTRMGLNLSVKIQSDLFFAGQILMAGTENSFDAHADWAFARYTATPEISLLFGKMKYPNLFYSEVYDVGLLYPWVRPPQETYLLRANTGSNALYESIDGVSVLYSRDIGEQDAEISLQAYVGAGGMEIGKVNDMVGLVAGLLDERYELKIGFNAGELDTGAGGHGAEEEEGFELAEFDGAKIDIKTFNLSAKTEWGDWMGLGEWTKTQYDGFDEIETQTHYVALGYNITPKYLVHLTGARFKQQIGRKQNSVTLGLRHKINESAAIKFEVSQVRGYAPVDDDDEDEGEEEEHQGPVTFGLLQGESNRATIFTLTLDFVF